MSVVSERNKLYKKKKNGSKVKKDTLIGIQNNKMAVNLSEVLSR